MTPRGDNDLASGKKKKYPNNNYIDLGSGNGKIVKRLTEESINIQGIEINPFLVALSKRTLGKNKHLIHRGNMWDKDLGQYDGIIIYTLQEVMNELYRKLTKELKPKTIVISVRFPIKGFNEIHQEEGVYFYQM